MKKVILIPDSFKGTMSSAEICTVMAQAVQEYYPDAQVHSVPVADGGEGSVDSFLQAVGGEKVSVTVKGPYFEEVPAFYGMLPDGVAVIEMAAAAGLPLVGERLHAEQTTTYGVGELMAHALERGCKRLVVGLGGSATNDGGCGAAAALGAVFRNAAGEAFVPVGATLAEVAEIDLSGLHPALASAELVTMCDIDNPLCGPLGAGVRAPERRGPGHGGASGRGPGALGGCCGALYRARHPAAPWCGRGRRHGRRHGGLFRQHAANGH